MQKDKSIRDSDIDDTIRFFANTLHEIRTPIQTIIGSAELMQGTKLDKEQTEYIRQIMFSAEGLLELANDILDLAKIHQSELKLESIPFDIASVTERLVDSESIKAFNRGVEIVLDISSDLPALVTGDAMRVRQIMLNLIGNAVKFTNEGYIHVELGYNSVDGVCFTVTDSGIGISEEKQRKLFTEYFQADISTYRLFGGTGLGLSICRNLVTVMNGKIGVRSNPAGGSVFWFTLPLPVAIEKSSKVSFCSNPEKHRILIVDDNLLACQSLQKKLAYFGFTSVEICTEPSYALSLIEHADSEGFPFKICFIALVLKGGIDGWHIGFDIQHSKHLKNRNSLYLLVPEGQMLEEAKMCFLNLYKGYIYKPVKREPLSEVLKSEFSEIEQLVTAEDNVSPKEKKVAQGLRILVAEDHPMNRKLLETFLRKFGAEVYLAENGVQALEIIKNIPEISMVFMDIYMPGKDGIETTKELRSMHYNEIIIACTANNDSNDFEEYKRIGINDILVKPFESKALYAMIEKWKEVMQTMSFEQINLLNNGTDFYIEEVEEID